MLITFTGSFQRRRSGVALADDCGLSAHSDSNLWPLFLKKKKAYERVCQNFQFKVSNGLDFMQLKRIKLQIVIDETGDGRKY